jgi:alpha/beta superfamily hydrolase
MPSKTSVRIWVACLLPLALGLGFHPAKAAAETSSLKSTALAASPANPLALPVASSLSPEDRILNWIRPARVDVAELSPDGGHLAYVARDANRVQIVLMDLALPESLAHFEVHQATFLRWASPQRLVVGEGTEGIYAVDADGTRLTKLISGKDVGMLEKPTLSSVAPFTPPDELLAPNQLDGMINSPRYSMDRAQYTNQHRSETGFGAAGNGKLDTAYNDSMSYVHPGSDIDRATDMAAPLETGRTREFTADPIPRLPRVVALPPDDPGHIIVEATGGRDSLRGLYSYGLYRVDVENGHCEARGEADLPGNRVIYDQSGRLRIVLSSVGGAYLHVFPSGAVWRGARSLDRLVRDPAGGGFRADPDTFLAAHSVPIGFGPDPTILYYASNLGRDTTGLYALDLKSGERTSFAVESPNFDAIDSNSAGNTWSANEADSPLVFDPNGHELVGVRMAGLKPSTRWLDPELGQIQAQLDRQFSGRSAQILQWDDRRSRYLIFTTGPSDPGRYYVYTAATGQMLLCARRAPWIASEGASPTLLFALKADDGTPITGSLTLARHARLIPAPMVVLCPDGPGQSLPPQFDPEAQAFSGMGFMVLRVNYRGTGGLGLRHLGALRHSIDAGPIDEILVAVKAIQARMRIDSKRIAVVGEGFGGYLALRAVQIQPQWFRTAVSIDAPLDLGRWVNEGDLIAHAELKREDQARFQTLSAEQQAANPLLMLDTLHATANPPSPTPPGEISPKLFAAKARLAFFGGAAVDYAAVSPIRAPQSLLRPTLIIQDSDADPAFVSAAAALRQSIEKKGGQVDFQEVHGRFADMSTVERVKVLARIEAFLNLDFYSYRVDIGELKTRD